MFSKYLKIFYCSKKFIIAFAVIILFILPNISHAASLFISPSASTVSVGNIFTVKIYVNTSGKSINNTEATIQFPTDMLEVVSVSKSSSVFNLWVEEPSYSNMLGTVTLNGGVPNPGYTGSNGFVSSITFKAKKTGTASVVLGDSAVRENDGLGTNILTSKTGSVIEIGVTKEIEIPATVDKDAVPARPSITSATHPNQAQWYSSNIASFDWKIPIGVTSIQASLDKESTSIPKTAYDNSVTQKTINNISDGTYYFHLRYYNSLGWGQTAHYKINVDSAPPKPFTPTVRIENNQNLVKFNAEDAVSGIDYFVIHTDDNQTLNIKNEDLVNGEYIMPVLNQGMHNFTIEAYDKAGNHTESNFSFTSSSISAPTLSLSTNEITKGETIAVSGKSDYPNKQVEITLKIDGSVIKKYTQTVSPDGLFVITTSKIKNIGTIEISAENVLSDNIRSEPSASLFLKVNQKKAVVVTVALLWVILFLILIVVLLILLYMGWRKFFTFRKTFEKDLEHTVSDVHKETMSIKDGLKEQLQALEKIKVDRELNEKEEMVFRNIQKSIDDIDKFVEDKLKKFM
jgi:uncharacterized protein YxeA